MVERKEPKLLPGAPWPTGQSCPGWPGPLSGFSPHSLHALLPVGWPGQAALVEKIVQRPSLIKD